MGTENTTTTLGRSRALIRCGSGQLTMELTLAASKVRHARAVVVGCLRLWSLAELADDVAVIVTELLSNVLCHALTPDGSPDPQASLLVQWAPGGVVVIIHDNDPTIPGFSQRGPVDELSIHGRGLDLVRALASDFRFASSPAGGKDAIVRIDRVPSSVSRVTARLVN
ncbi:ATP-binding protein [Kitasatospora viridis]|uniref:Anti-sigma regulatory factor (Ser/Thr protein kinase) n=1 Tax=Kitasatospora viridis TaxID=281105 RepID=A0A561SAB3_9ACTN|nr:ATP-binding protein [Kitasatospora viridis]TWF71818.1 anti-sigma regulatory factor (Ser/Thr protein kinase) [Kitasatospora viridis]